MKPLQIIVGLGNPGLEYEYTRHNAGFWFVDALAQQWKLSFSYEKKYHAHVAKTKLEGRDCYLLKPDTFMNKSGLSVQALSSFFKIEPSAILVVHDELDIPCGWVKIKEGGGNGGHNGLKSIQSDLGTPDFVRLRLGIGHPGSKELVLGHVLNKPSKDERLLIDEAISKSLEGMPSLMSGDLSQAQHILHKK